MVFPEWNSAKRLTQVRVKKGTRIVFGTGKGQTLKASETFDGTVKSLPDSADWQFSFPPDDVWLQQGHNPGDWMAELFRRGNLTIVEDIATGWKP